MAVELEFNLEFNILSFNLNLDYIYLSNAVINVLSYVGIYGSKIIDVSKGFLCLSSLFSQLTLLLIITERMN